VLILDGAGWHQAGGKLIVPENITLLALAPYAAGAEPHGKTSGNICVATSSVRLFGTHTNAIVQACRGACSSWSMTQPASNQSGP